MSLLPRLFFAGARSYFRTGLFKDGWDDFFERISSLIAMNTDI